MKNTIYALNSLKMSCVKFSLPFSNSCFTLLPGPVSAWRSWLRLQFGVFSGQAGAGSCGCWCHTISDCCRCRWICFALASSHCRRYFFSHLFKWGLDSQDAAQDDHFICIRNTHTCTFTRRTVYKQECIYECMQMQTHTHTHMLW